jgi:hypothetical protein
MKSAIAVIALLGLTMENTSAISLQSHHKHHHKKHHEKTAV